jgi:ketosteroid isomerase-like protein
VRPARRGWFALPAVVGLVLSLVGCGGSGPVDTRAAEEEVVAEVAGLIEIQVAAWNDGDLVGFTGLYDEACTFLSTTGLTRGRQGVLDRYRSRYPDRAAMGRLSIEVEEMRPAVLTVASLWGLVEGRHIGGVSVAGRWRLTYPDRPTAEGLTLIVFRRTPEGWRIVQDASM